MYGELQHLNSFLKSISHNYVLIIIAAALFFVIKAMIGLFTYRRLKKELNTIKQTVLQIREELLTEEKIKGS